MGEQRIDAETGKFLGVFEHALDEKGRVSFPISFRQIAAGSNKVILTNFLCDGARCLEGYLPESWGAFVQKLKAKSRFDPQLIRLENFYISRAAECPFDSSGRINIPSHLRSYAGLEREVVFTSGLHGFRIWDRRVWELVFRESEAALLSDPNLFKDVDR